MSAPVPAPATDPAAAATAKIIEFASQRKCKLDSIDAYNENLGMGHVEALRHEAHGTWGMCSSSSSSRQKHRNCRNCSRGKALCHLLL